MTTLQQLRREKAKLQAKLSSQRDYVKIQSERNALKKEIKAMKNPGSTRFKKFLRKNLISAGRSTLKIIDDTTRPVPMRRKPMKKRKR